MQVRFSSWRSSEGASEFWSVKRAEKWEWWRLAGSSVFSMKLHLTLIIVSLMLVVSATSCTNIGVAKTNESVRQRAPKNWPIGILRGSKLSSLKDTPCALTRELLVMTLLGRLVSSLQILYTAWNYLVEYPDPVLAPWLCNQVPRVFRGSNPLPRYGHSSFVPVCLGAWATSHGCIGCILCGESYLSVI